MFVARRWWTINPSLRVVRSFGHGAPIVQHLTMDGDEVFSARFPVALLVRKFTPSPFIAAHCNEVFQPSRSVLGVGHILSSSRELPHSGIHVGAAVNEGRR